MPLQGFQNVPPSLDTSSLTCWAATGFYPMFFLLHMPNFNKYAMSKSMNKHKQLTKLIQHHYSLILWGYWGLYQVYLVARLILVAHAATSEHQTAKWASPASATSPRFACTDLKLFPAMAFHPFCANTEYFKLAEMLGDIGCDGLAKDLRSGHSQPETTNNLRNSPALIIKFEPPNANHPIKTQCTRTEISVSCVPKFLYSSKLIHYSY